MTSNFESRGTINEGLIEITYDSLVCSMNKVSTTTIPDKWTDRETVCTKKLRNRLMIKKRNLFQFIQYNKQECTCSYILFNWFNSRTLKGFGWNMINFYWKSRLKVKHYSCGILRNIIHARSSIIAICWSHCESMFFTCGSQSSLSRVNKFISFSYLRLNMPYRN
jgi:hypothetical protein